MQKEQSTEAVEFSFDFVFGDKVSLLKKSVVEIPRFRARIVEVPSSQELLAQRPSFQEPHAEMTVLLGSLDWDRLANKENNDFGSTTISPTSPTPPPCFQRTVGFFKHSQNEAIKPSIHSTAEPIKAETYRKPEGVAVSVPSSELPVDFKKQPNKGVLRVKEFDNFLAFENVSFSGSTRY